MHLGGALTCKGSAGRAALALHVTLLHPRHLVGRLLAVAVAVLLMGGLVLVLLYVLHVVEDAALHRQRKVSCKPPNDRSKQELGQQDLCPRHQNVDRQGQNIGGTVAVFSSPSSVEF